MLDKEYPEAHCTLSSEICPEIREYERCSTTVINSFLANAVGSYFKELDHQLAEGGLKSGIQIMQSNGGVTTSGFIEDRPVNIFLSGPAGGVVGASHRGSFPL